MRSISRSRPMTGSSFFSRASWVRLRPNWSRTSEPDGACSPPEEPAVAPAFSELPPGPGVAGQELDDLLADPGQVGAQLDQDLGGHALALTDEPEEDVLGADVVVAELERLTQRELEDLLGPGRERDVAAGGGSALADDLLDLGPDGLQRDAERLERLGRDTFALVDQPQEDVLGTDVVVVEETGFFLGQDDHPASPVGEALKQDSRASHSWGWSPRSVPPTLSNARPGPCLLTALSQASHWCSDRRPIPRSEPRGAADRFAHSRARA